MVCLLQLPLFYFSQAAEYNAALCIEWLTCMAPKNRMVIFFLSVLLLGQQIMVRNDFNCYHLVDSPSKSTSAFLRPFLFPCQIALWKSTEISSSDSVVSISGAEHPTLRAGKSKNWNQKILVPVWLCACAWFNNSFWTCADRVTAVANAGSPSNFSQRSGCCFVQLTRGIAASVKTRLNCLLYILICCVPGSPVGSG